ncbi:LemA family protein [Soonwooa sp.]|uniref:LemA family protein n=1 Tax=Soonwooa sp. TaxID=1938592 RepID=UPI00261AFB21|nr:LemA family protein [Soonwooa sp.]
MKGKGCLVLVIALVVIAGIAFMWGVGVRNNFNVQKQEVESKWGNVQTAYQKRADLIPNLERAVKSYAKFEQETLTQVVEARSKASAVQIDPTNMTEADMAKFEAAQGQLSGALGRLMVVVEKYPDLKASQQYTDFQREYVAVENSIRTERVYYNDAAKVYNTAVENFPQNLVASMTNYKAKPYFQAEAGADKAPEVFK